MIIDDRCDPCARCPCLDTRLAPCFRRDNISTDIAIVIEHPTALEQAKKTLLTGDTGQVASRTLRAFGVDINQCYVTTALNCRPAQNKDPMKKAAMLACKDRLIAELKDSGCKKVLCLGPIGFSQLMDADRILPITKVRGRWEQRHGFDIIATFNPSWFFGEKDYFRDFVWDIEKFCRTSPETAPELEMWYPQTIKETIEAFEYLAEASFVSCDVETTGISIASEDLLAVGFGVIYADSNDGCSIVLRKDILEADDTWVEIAHLLQREEQATVFHNSKFDLKYLRRDLLARGMTYDPRHVEDTMMLHYCIDERPMGRFQSHSLKNMARVRCDAPDYDINMKKWIEEYNSEQTTEERRTEMRSRMHEYLALDVYYTARMYPDLVNEVMEDDPQLMDHYQNLLMPAMAALVEIEMHGAPVDRAFFETQWESLQDRAAPVLERLQRNTGLPEFNPNSPQQVAKLLYEDLALPVLRTARRGKQQEGKTSKQILKMLKRRMEKGELPDHVQLIDDIMEYRNLIKNAGTYVKGILTRMDEDDRIRCDLLPHGTATGRLSSQNPNLQNIPEASHTKVEIRNGYIAPPGYLLGNADYSQLELRVAAWLSGDEEFKQVYVEDRDLHQEVAFTFFGKPKELVTPYERYMAKCMNFGVIYFRGADSLAYGPEMDYVEDVLGGDRWTLAEVKEFFDKFFGKFPRFKEWMDETYNLGYTQQWIQTPFGNKRRFEFIPRNDKGVTGRAAVNSPIQGTAALITLGSLVRIHDRFKEINERYNHLVAQVILTVHDSIMFLVDVHYIEEVEEIVLWEMQENIPLDIDIPMKADVEYAPRWGEVKDWDLAENLPAVLEGLEVE